MSPGRALNVGLAGGLLVVLTIVPPQAYGADAAALAFRAADYPAEVYSTCQLERELGDVTVSIIQVRTRTRELEAKPSSCRAWVQSKKNDTVVAERFYDEIEALGGYFGIFLPQTQRIKDHLVLIKAGDYDGRLLIVGPDGSITDKPGGRFVIAESCGVLLSEYYSDLTGITAVDLQTGKVLLESEDVPHVVAWYRHKGEYFYLSTDSPPTDPHRIYSVSVVVYRCDKKDLEARVLPRSVLERSEEVPYAYILKSDESCECGGE